VPSAPCVICEPAHADLVARLDADVSFGPEYLAAPRAVPEELAALNRFPPVLCEPCGYEWEPVYVTGTPQVTVAGQRPYAPNRWSVFGGGMLCS
jgi:hypothetical protein